jgi:hypothetical protein
MFLLKASDVSSLTSARFFAANNFDWISFNFQEAYQLERIKELISWIEGPLFLGYFDNNTSWDQIFEVVSSLNLSAIEFDFNGDFNHINQVENYLPDVSLFLRIKANQLGLVQNNVSSNVHLVVYGDTQEVMAQVASTNLHHSHKIWLHLSSLDQQLTIKELDDAAYFTGLSFTEEKENKVGFCDFEQIQDFLDSITS